VAAISELMMHSDTSSFVLVRCLDANMIEIPVKIETPDHHYYHVWILHLESYYHAFIEYTSLYSQSTMSLWINFFSLLSSQQEE
jgi:hypothetical protein